MEVVSPRTLAPEPSPQPIQKVSAGRLPRKGFLGALGFMDGEGHGGQK